MGHSPKMDEKSLEEQKRMEGSFRLLDSFRVWGDRLEFFFFFWLIGWLSGILISALLECLGEE